MRVDITMRVKEMLLNIGPWIKGEWKDALFDPVIGQVGEGVFGLVMGGGLIFAFYLAGDGDLAVPAVATMLTAGFMVPILPGDAQAAAYVVAFMGLVAAITSIGRSYVLEGGGY